MSAIYEEIEIEDMKYDEELQKYTYPCPCGDKFSITLEDLLDEEDIGKIIYILIIIIFIIFL